jgi:membrane-bound ClpP family serine protease
MTDNTAEITIAILIASTVFITKEEYVVQAWCGIGGVMSGYVGSMLFPIKGMQMRVRWVTSVICAVICAPALTTYFHAKFPTFPIAQIALLTSGACAVFGIMILQIIKPMIAPILKAILPGALSKFLDRKQDDEKDG